MKHTYFTFAWLAASIGVSAAAGCGIEPPDAALGVTTAAVTQALSIPFQMPSATIDFTHRTVTLPLHRARGPGGLPLYFVLTDTSDLTEAVRLGINWSPKLRHALGTPAVQRAVVRRTPDEPLGFTVELPGKVNFRPAHVVVPGPDLFPLGAGTRPGSVGDASYSPLFAGDDGVVYNGPQIENLTGHHDKLLAIDLRAMTATLQLTAGFYLGRDVLYLSTESSVSDIAALELATYAPNLAAAPAAGNDDPSSSAREPILLILNGAMGVDNPQRQGIKSAVAGEGDPLNIIREEPECSDPQDPENCSALEYSPLWDQHPLSWTQAAIDAGQRVRLRSHEVAEQLFESASLVNAAPQGPVNDDPEIRGLRASGIVVNCPPVFVAPAI